MLNWIKSVLYGRSENLSEKGQYILLVDDSEVERTFYRKTLMKAGYQIFAASNALIAIESLKKRKPDLILLDLLMPDMNGKEMCRRIKCNDETKDIPVIFLTGNAKPGEVVECFDAGGEHYLEKPINGRTLVLEVGNILSDMKINNMVNSS